LDESRFVVHFNPEFVNLDPSVATNNISIYSFNKSVFVNYHLQSPADILVYDITGRIIAEESLKHGLNEIQLHVETGYFFVKVISSANIKTQKVFIK